MIGSCELPDFYTYTEPVARKQHKCCECSAPILKGEKHFRVFGRWIFEISVYRQHLVCMEACIVIRDHFNDHECIGFGTLKDAWSELRPDRKFFDKSGRYKSAWKKLRGLMARILWRERTGKPC